MRATLPYPPSVNRYWRHGRGRTYLSEEGERYKQGVALRLLTQGWRVPLRGPVVVSVWVYRPRRSGDLDNVLKALLDALQGRAYLDDDQVVELHARRAEDAARPRVVVDVLPEEGSTP